MNDKEQLPRAPIVSSQAGEEVREAVFSTKIDAAFVLAKEIKRRKHAVAVLAKFVAYEPWMNDHPDDAEVSTYKRHTFGTLREAVKIIEGEMIQDGEKS
jgi:hypothetical protein